MTEDTTKSEAVGPRLDRGVRRAQAKARGLVCRCGATKTSAKTWLCPPCQEQYKVDHGTPAICKHCGAPFIATGTPPKSYCSRECRYEDKKGLKVECRGCGRKIDGGATNPFSDELRKYCSDECCRNHKIAGEAAHWKGGRSVESSGAVQVYVSKNQHVLEHRLICARAIGRPLTRTEKVIHIDMNYSNNDPLNLFICESHGEFGKRFQGTLPWPDKSNLETYVGGYARNCGPNVGGDAGQAANAD